jgi:phosphoglycolate phosphatase-like HAD superfamily hydrolase
VKAIEAVLFEPVGCLAEFPATEFETAARELFAQAAPGDDCANGGSHAYWRLMELVGSGAPLLAAAAARFAELELAAVERAELYEDVPPSLARLRDAGVRACLVSSLSRAAVVRFVERFSLADAFAVTVTRDDAPGVMVQPLRYVMTREALDPARTICLVDNAVALDLCKQEGVNPLLMINDYDEGRALAERGAAGGVVSLAELADALLLIDQRAGLRRDAPPLPRTPFELFDPG